MDVTQLEYFKMIAETGSLTRAAEQMHISQPAMSAMLKKFETELNAELFDRTPNRIQLNATGAAALVHAENILRDVEQMRADVAALARKNLSLSVAFCDPGLRWFWAPRFALACPDVKLNDLMYDRSDMEEQLLKRGFDVAVTPAPIRNARIQSAPFLKDQVYLSVPRDNSLVRRERVRLEEIPAQPFLLPEIGGYFIAQIKRILSERNPRVSVVKNEYNTTQHLIRTTHFLAAISTLSYDLRNDGDNRLRIPVENPEMNVTYSISFLKSNREKVKKFLKWAEEIKADCGEIGF